MYKKKAETEIDYSGAYTQYLLLHGGNYIWINYIRRD